jgi:hypothetical protein
MKSMILSAMISNAYTIKFNSLKPGVRKVILTYGETLIKSVAMLWSDTTDMIDRINKARKNKFKLIRKRVFVFLYESKYTYNRPIKSVISITKQIIATV